MELIQKLLKNIVDNYKEEKYRTVKQNNPKIKDNITKYYNGIQILKMLGFQEFYDPQAKETILKMPMTVSLTYLKGKKLDIDGVINKFFIEQK